MCVWKFERVVWMVIDWCSLDGCGTAQFACTRRFPKDLGNMFSKDAGEHGCSEKTENTVMKVYW